MARKIIISALMALATISIVAAIGAAAIAVAVISNYGKAILVGGILGASLLTVGIIAAIVAYKIGGNK